MTLLTATLIVMALIPAVICALMVVTLILFTYKAMNND